MKSESLGVEPGAGFSDSPGGSQVSLFLPSASRIRKDSIKKHAASFLVLSPNCREVELAREQSQAGLGLNFGSATYWLSSILSHGACFLNYDNTVNNKN
jgi:hypothetical protein